MYAARQMAWCTVVAIMCQPEYGAKPHWSGRVFHYQPVANGRELSQHDSGRRRYAGSAGPRALHR